MKLLYLSCHEVHERDDLILFEELGLDIFSHGAYLDPTVPQKMRPGLPPSPHWLGVTHPEYIELARQHPKETLVPEQVEPFDVVYVMHTPRWIYSNWELLKHKVVIWRTTGQSSPPDEASLARCRAEGMRIVRYSPAETRIPGYIGEDYVIRFYKDPDEYQGWNGRIPRIINFTQNFKARGLFCNYDTFVKATNGFPRLIFGPDNESSGALSGGFLSHEDMLRTLQDNRVYFYTGTMPAPYVLNLIEAWMLGIPIVSIGPLLGNPFFLPGQFTFEAHELIENGQQGFWSDDLDELRWYIKLLLERESVAQFISERGRARAIEIFGKERIKSEWKAFFESL